MTTLSHPSVLHRYLRQIGKKPSKSLSQNFLIDSNIVEQFVKRAQLSEEDFVLEIGPGPGAFTQEIAKQGVELLAIEKDAGFAKGLHEQYGLNPLVRVLEDDFLKCDLNKLLPQQKRVKILSNLPFQLTSPILGKLLPLSDRIHSCLFILQKEVADRILASPKSKAFSSLTLFTQFYSKPSFCFNISSSCFFPKPSIASTALLFELQKPPIKDSQVFFQWVRQAFNQRRKMLSSSLPLKKSDVQDGLRSLGLSEKSRPEELSLTSWIDLYQLLFASLPLINEPSNEK